MIALMLLVGAVATEVLDPCVGVDAPTGHAPDPAAAALYRAVGDEEMAAGHAATAKTAYRQALRRDPGDAAARSGWEAMCRGQTDLGPAPSGPTIDIAQAHFEEGVRQMRRGDRAAAISAFETVRAAGPDPGAALLEGICQFELGADQRARVLLEEARSTPGIGATALFFLGLIALRDGDDQVASTLLAAAVADDNRIGASAAGLLRLARRDGRLVLSAATEMGFDSNVALAPDGTANPGGVGEGGVGDGYGVGMIGTVLRPFGQSGPYARVTAQYRKQLQVTAYDLGDLSGAVGFHAGRSDHAVAAEYGYDIVSLGGNPYLSAHRLLGTGRVTHRALSLTATYAARFESFLTSNAAGYSGLRHEAQATADWGLPRGFALGLGYHLDRDGARDAVLSYFEQGPLVLLWLGRGSALRLLAEARLTFREYAQVDPDYGLARSDRYLDASAAGEIDLSDHWTLRITAGGRRALSNVADLEYTKLTTGVGLAYTIGAR